jgi:hypothetical protein
MWGAREPYHVAPLNYSIDFADTPKNIGEEFRWNVPVLYYTYDQSFYDYFGSNGVYAVDSAVAIMNGLTNVSSYSPYLTEFPLESTRINWAGSAMHLFDLKSCALEMLVEDRGLTDPERFTWTLRNRALPTGAACPSYVYTVIKRNFDPVTWEPSIYLNGNLYTYQIVEGCPAVDVADAIEILVDPSQVYLSAVASPKIMFHAARGTLFYGYFYTGLTRDDVGGLRYLYRSTNMNIESAGPGTSSFVTNTTTELLFTSNLTALAQAAYTNNTAALSALFPGLQILTTTNWFTNIYLTNFTAFFTNYPWDPVGTAPHVAFSTNVTPTVVQVYSHTFGNLFSVEFGPNGWQSLPLFSIPPAEPGVFVTIQTSTSGITNYPWNPVGLTNFFTNFSSVTYTTNAVSGNYVLLPTNYCAVNLLYSQLTNVISYTNPIVSATNNLPITNSFGAPITYSQDLINYFTNNVFVILGVQCAQTNVALRQGIEMMQYVRRDYDSLFNRFWEPITNFFNAMTVTNNSAVPQIVERIVTSPDILFQAGDLAGAPSTWPIVNATCSRGVPNLDTNGIANAVPSPFPVYGPGTLETTSPLIFTFNKVGPLWFNIGPFFLDEKSADLDFIWASFDGTTNAPVVYPTTASIRAIEAQVFMQLGPANAPDGKVGVPYSLQFTGSGGQPPYTFSLSPQSPGLPPGFVGPQPDGSFPGGMIYGTPLQSGTYDFSIRMTDAAGRYVDHPYSLTISP